MNIIYLLLLAVIALFVTIVIIIMRRGKINVAIAEKLALIDEAQKRITELSSNILNLKEILADKSARGAFGEIQLHNLINNTLPTQNFSFQHTLSNNKRADCMLFLPEPTGNIVIDAKFPLENYQRFTDLKLSKIEREQARQLFRQDIRKHLNDIAEKYIIPGETADGAMMFIPAEAIFAEIHSHHPELVAMSHKLHVWLVSPATMMAVLNTARAVLKESATRTQIHIIQKHLIELGKDFSRFQKRMDNLARHINLAYDDSGQVATSAKKISALFNKIERVELDEI